MKYDPANHHRRSIRLKGYDYRQPGVYFITTNTYRKLPLFGAISEGKMKLSPAGIILQQVWSDLPLHYPNVCLDAICIMPDHVHMILRLLPCDHDRPVWPVTEVVRALKSFSAKRINLLSKTPGRPVWQRNYYERILRDDAELDRIRAYIQNNPERWDVDP